MEKDILREIENLLFQLKCVENLSQNKLNKKVILKHKMNLKISLFQKVSYLLNSDSDINIDGILYQVVLVKV